MTDIDLNEVAKALQEQQARAVALEAVLNNAADIGIEDALSRFGAALTDTEKEILKTLTPEELASLKSILSKLGTQMLFQSVGIAF
ncbi:hypothetical protein H6F98_08405 [Microcoleus sp. FACHB-SPT15]|uniref:hypothetical protein n=1 Tax=Microcoleus sp. FACHB-SPT15 TaxID=2692830 RepID=UPI00177D255A|nr:hypothetical protein [Microcoleus sp. FACHB-SPT15]MBD1805468.1 hypothetical protein [Microcoleus sp. FACHB-SPT15]